MVAIRQVNVNVLLSMLAIVNIAKRLSNSRNTDNQPRYVLLQEFTLLGLLEL